MDYKPKKSILLQLTLVIAGASILSALISSIGHYIFTTSLIKDSVNDQVSTALELTSNYLEEKYTNQINHDLNLLNNSQIINELLEDDIQHYNEDKLIAAENLLSNFSSNRDNLYNSILLINKNGDQVVAIENGIKNREKINIIEENKTSKDIQTADLFQALKKSPYTTSIYSKPITKDKQHLFLAGISKKTTGQQRRSLNNFNGAVIIIFNIDSFISYLKNFKIFEHSMIWLFTHTGKELHQPTDNISINPFPFIFDQVEKPKNLTLVSSPQEDRNSLQHILKIIISLPPEITGQLFRKSVFITMLILISITLVVFFIAYFTAKKIILPIRRLTQLSQKVAAGDFSVKMPTTKNDEIGILSQAFNIMIQELDEQRYELKSLANKDTLTQLPNRRQFEEHLNMAVKNCQRNNQSIAVIYLDLDQFKDTNDSFGHPAGDKLIRDVSTRLLKTVRQNDLVARLGGDEFAVILTPHKTKADTEHVAKKILVELNKPFMIEKHQIFSGGSIGISIYPEHGENATELVKNADAAMYKAKNMGRNSYQFYSTNLTEKANERVVLGALIRNALEIDEFTIFYQPKISFSSKNIIGAEALLRWEHKGQTILPTKVIDIAESSGFIERIDSWVLHTVCKQIQHWQELKLPIVPISVNISGRLLEKNKIIDILKKALHKFSVDPKWIEIEITENHLIGNPQQTQKALKIIHSLGVKVAIDDFGTGYSSLSYLKDLLADTLKIDRKFVVNAMTNHADKEIATAIVKLACSLNMHVVVEGIETEEQADFFKELGSHSAQGYLYAKPMPVEQLVDFIDSNLTDAANLELKA